MTTYHIEHRVPRPGERFLHRLARADGNPTINNTVPADAMGGYGPRYVLTPDRPQSDHPEALLIRAGGDLWARIEPLLGDAYYQRLYCLQDDNERAPQDFNEWEDVYDEVPEPEPEHPTSDIILIKAIANDAGLVSLPVYALRRSTDDMYTTPNFASIRPVDITAWDDIDAGEEH